MCHVRSNSPDRRSRLRGVSHFLVVAFLLGAACTPTGLHAQTIEDQIRVLTGANAEGYLSPVARGIGYALTSGPFDRAGVLGLLHVDAGIRVAAALASDVDRSFEAVLPGSISWSHPSIGTRTYEDPYTPVGGDPTTPTAMGGGSGVVLDPSGAFRDDLIQAGRNPNDYQIRFPSGLDFSLIPAAFLHLSVGVGFGSELTLRYLPELSVAPDVGRFSGHGFALKHEISQWIAVPIDLSVGVGSHTLSADGYLEASTLEGWFLAGRGLGPLSVFGMAGLRRASVDVRYQAENPFDIPGGPDDGIDIRFTSDIDTTASWGGGVRLQLLLLNLAGHYVGGEHSSFSLKVGIAVP